MYKFILIILVGLMIQSCGAPDKKKLGSGSDLPKREDKKVNDSLGIGKIKSVELTDPLDQAMIARGSEIYDIKCLACHKLTGERIVGPGFEGITNRRRPEWIMNMITNSEEMLDKDPVAISLLEICLTRMPNQNVTEAEARYIVEFMRNNDLDRLGTKDGAVAEAVTN